MSAVLWFFIGATLGAIAMSLVTLSRSQDDDEVEDTELLDFMTRNDLGLSVIKQGGGSAMWGVTTAAPVKMVGTLAHDPRDALSQAAVLMLEKEPANG